MRLIVVSIDNLNSFFHLFENVFQMCSFENIFQKYIMFPQKTLQLGYLVLREQFSFNFYNQGVFETLKNSVTSRCKFFLSMKIDKNSKFFRLGKVRMKYVGTIALFHLFVTMTILSLDCSSSKNNYRSSKILA